MKAVVGVIALGGLLLAAPAAASAPAASGSGYVKSGHVAFGSCAANDIEMRVTMPKLSYTARQPVAFTVDVHNVGTTSCDYPGPIGTSSVGPCASIQMTVHNAKGVNVWPGTINFMCPPPPPRSLSAKAHFSAQGSWNQRFGYISHGLAPRGNYRLIVEGRFSFPIVLQ